MAKYIEREALREAFIKHFDAVCDDGKLVFSDHICTAEDCEDILKLVAELPTADVVPVVRCKDCKHWNKTDTDIIVNIDYGKCTNSNSPYHNEEETTGGDYCSYGERRCSG